MSMTDFQRLGQEDAGWRDIASAPINQAVLVHIPNGEYYCNNCAYAAMLVDMGTGKRWMTFGWAIGRDCSIDMQPTHWMPLPPPPVAAGLVPGEG